MQGDERVRWKENVSDLGHVEVWVVMGHPSGKVTQAVEEVELTVISMAAMLKTVG